jgi:hypothetical protein
MKPTVETLKQAHAELDPIGNNNRIPDTLAGVTAIAAHLGLDMEELRQAMIRRGMQVSGVGVSDLSNYAAGYLDGVLAATCVAQREET